MNTDSYYEIGSSHLYCQDYALHGNFLNYNQEEVHFTVIADGCSSALDSDVGARILALACASAIKSFFTLPATAIDGCGPEPYQYDYNKVYEILGFWTLRAARMSKQFLKISEESLYSTILISVCHKDYKFVAIYGDGLAVVEHEDRFDFYQVEFPQNAPFYLAYWDKPTELEKYKKEFGEKKKITKSFLMKELVIPEEEWVEHQVSFQYKTWWDLDKEQGKEILSVSLFTDGINTYKMGSRKLSSWKIATEILGFKSTVGEFLRRRMIKLKRDYLDSKINHYDDIGCSTIILAGENK